MWFKGLNFNVSDPEAFDQCVEGIRKSISTPDHFFCSDNILTWNRNLGFLDNQRFLDTLRRNSTNNIELSIIWRTYILCWFARYAKAINGDFVEIGAYEGNTANIILEEADLAATGKSYFVYDAFEHSEKDINHWMPEHGPGLFNKVCARFKKYDFVKVVKGYVPDSFALNFPEKIAFAHIDLNQAPAEVGALRQIIPVLAPGAVIVLDDYGWYAYHQQKEAEDPLFAEYGLEVLELPTGQGLVLNHYS